MRTAAAKAATNHSKCSANSLLIWAKRHIGAKAQAAMATQGRAKAADAVTCARNRDRRLGDAARLPDLI